MKALLLNYPDDPSVWDIEDQYLLGDDILIAPLLERDTEGRQVYLPKGKWVNHSDKKVYEGGQWYRMQAGTLRGLILYRYGALIPVMPLVQTTAEMKWEEVILIAFSDGEEGTIGFLKQPDEDQIIRFESNFFNGEWKLASASLSTLKSKSYKTL